MLLDSGDDVLGARCRGNLGVCCLSVGRCAFGTRSEGAGTRAAKCGRDGALNFSIDVQLASEVSQVNQQVLRRLIPFVLILGQALGHNLFQTIRHAFDQCGQRLRFGLLDGDDLPVNVLSLKRHAAGQHFVKQHTETPDVCALVYAFSD